MQAIAAAAVGIANAINRFDASAQRTARWGSSVGADVDLAQEAVEMVNAKAALKANVQVMRTADGMTGVLLDIIA